MLSLYILYNCEQNVIDTVFYQISRMSGWNLSMGLSDRNLWYCDFSKEVWEVNQEGWGKIYKQLDESEDLTHPLILIVITPYTSVPRDIEEDTRVEQLVNFLGEDSIADLFSTLSL